MTNIHYDGSLGCYVATINNKQYKLLALNYVDAKVETAAMRKFMEA